MYNVNCENEVTYDELRSYLIELYNAGFEPVKEFGCQNPNNLKTSIEGVKLKEILWIGEKDNYTVNDIDNNVKLMLATEQIYLKDSSFKSGNFPIIKTKVEMQNEMQNIFGNSVIYADSNITLNCKGVGLYDENNQTYTFTEPEGCGGTLTPHIESKAVSATKYSDKLEIVEKMAYIDYTEGANGLITNVHKNVNDTSIIGTLSDNDDIFTLYGDKLDSYKYSFKYENGNYYFESIEKIS